MNECEAKKCPKRKDMLRTSIRMRKGEEPSILNLLDQGPRRNFEIWGEGWWVGVEGGGVTVSDSILGGGHNTLFLTNSIILKILWGTCPRPRPPCSAVPVDKTMIQIVCHSANVRRTVQYCL